MIGEPTRWSVEWRYNKYHAGKPIWNIKIITLGKLVGY
jgi:hypothetical protein